MEGFYSKLKNGTLAASAAIAMSGYSSTILNQAPAFEPAHTYASVVQQEYVQQEHVAQQAENRYQNVTNQQSVAPLDPRQSMCPTQGHCLVCTRRCWTPMA